MRLWKDAFSKDLQLVWVTSIGPKEEILGVVLAPLYSKHACGVGERTEAWGRAGEAFLSQGQGSRPLAIHHHSPSLPF